MTSQYFKFEWKLHPMKMKYDLEKTNEKKHRKETEWEHKEEENAMQR